MIQIPLSFIILQSIYWIFPAYVANAAPILIRGKTPIDGGRKWKGKRILGDGKTIEGFIGGVAAGTLIGFLQGTVLLGLLLSIGALLGDMVGSFIKRRSGIKRGQPFIGMDQLGFLVGAVILASPVEVLGVQGLVIIFILTPLVHLASNIGAYFLKFKKVWW